MGVSMYYRKDLDEMKVYDRGSGESVVYIQGYSRKYPVPVNDVPTTELLVLMAVSYPEIEKVI